MVCQSAMPTISDLPLAHSFGRDCNTRGHLAGFPTIEPQLSCMKSFDHFCFKDFPRMSADSSFSQMRDRFSERACKFIHAMCAQDIFALCVSSIEDS